jgi:fatty-acyl-CoA synthase
MESYARGPEVPLLDSTIYEAFVKTASSHPDRLALVVRHQNVRLTWRQLVDEVDRTGESLNALGLQPGDRVGVWATNRVEWVLLQLACARQGLVQVNVNPAYRAHELRFVLRKSRMKALFLLDHDARSNYRQILADAQAQTDLALRHVVYLNDAGWGEFRASRTKGQPTVSPREVANIQYTSGTTGNPKGVLLTHHNVVNNAWLIRHCLALSERDQICVPVPLYHCFGCVGGTLTCLVSGASMVLPSPTFDPLLTLEALHEERSTVIYGVPTMFIAQLDHAEFARFDLTSLRTGIMAGAPCPIEVMRRVVSDMHCPQMTIVYGQTETSPVITGSAVDDPLETRVATVGRAFPQTEVKIVDPSGATVPVGEQGELCTRGYLVMKGYDDEPEATARTIDADGWLHTGDLARMREDGNFRITGRAKDMIIRGGENIYPREIEEFLYTHPAVSDAQVVGLPDEKFGEVVAVWIRLKPGTAATEEEIRAFCRGQIAHYKIPQFIRIVDEFPMTVTGKIQKFRMREIEIAERHLERASEIQTA